MQLSKQLKREARQRAEAEVERLRQILNIYKIPS
jgi:hypothetical protein